MYEYYYDDNWDYLSFFIFCKVWNRVNKFKKIVLMNVKYCS